MHTTDVLQLPVPYVTQGYVYFRHGDRACYQHMSSAQSAERPQARDIGAAMCHIVATAVDTYGLSPLYEDCVRLNWEGAKLQK